MPLVVHLIDFGDRNQWIEDQFPYFLEAGLSQGLISIAEPGELHETLRTSGFEKIEGFSRGLSGFFRAAKTLRNWSKREVVYVYAHGHLPAIYALAFTFFANVKYVICHHQPQSDFFSHLQKRGSRRAILHLTLMQLYYFKSQKIQSFSTEVTESLFRHRIKSSKIAFIPLGMRFEGFFKIPLGGEATSPTKIEIVSIGRLSWEKRFDLGIRCVSELIGLVYEISYTIVGTGPELSNLALLAKECGIEHSVNFLGHRDDINKLLNNADVFFHPGLTESYGQAIMEARLTDTPIFSSRSGVATDMERLRDPRVTIFDTDDYRQIAIIFRRLLDSKILVPCIQTFKEPTETYSAHKYELVLPRVTTMFLELFR